jgi:DNA anti-recombination protein RmuC
MRTKLSEVASGELAEDASRLGEGMRTLGNEMEGAGSTVEEMRSDLDEMLSRFRTFNNPGAGNGAS